MVEGRRVGQTRLDRAACKQRLEARKREGGSTALKTSRAKHCWQMKQRKSSRCAWLLEPREGERGGDSTGQEDLRQGEGTCTLQKRPRQGWALILHVKGGCPTLLFYCYDKQP